MWYVIHSAGVERMAFHQAFQTQPNAWHNAKASYRFAHIFGTCGMETASRRQPGGYGELIETERTDHSGLSPRNSFWISCSISGYVHSRAFRRGLITIDHRGFNPARCCRTASRTRRLMRFRTTALPRARGVVNPMCGPLAACSHTQKAVNNRHE
jgi:hypothetical protein